MLTLRPDADARFATNMYHGTWHILSDWHGAKILAQLLWGLAFQRKPGTLVLIDRPSLDPNPFDAAPSDPIVLMPSPLTGLTERAARELKRQLPLRHRPDGTVHWDTRGLGAAVSKARDWADIPMGHRLNEYDPSLKSREKVRRTGGLIVLAAGAGALRRWGVQAERLGDWWWHGTDYTFLADRDGEIQIFRQFRAEVSIARQARAEVLAARPPSEGLEEWIWDHAERVRRRRLPKIKSELSGYPELTALLKNENLSAHSFAHDVLVRCPRCDGCARMHSADRLNWRVTCPQCTLTLRREARCTRPTPSPVDPVFGLPVWLQAKQRNGKLLWAYNRLHLRLLRKTAEEGDDTNVLRAIDSLT